MFTDVDGTWLHPEKVSDEFRRIYKRAGLPPVNLRDCRRVAGTLVHAGGGDIHAVKQTLRHSTIQLTSDTYTELLEEVDRDIVSAVGSSPTRPTMQVFDLRKRLSGRANQDFGSTD